MGHTVHNNKKENRQQTHREHDTKRPWVYVLNIPASGEVIIEEKNNCSMVTTDNGNWTEILPLPWNRRCSIRPFFGQIYKGKGGTKTHTVSMSDWRVFVDSLANWIQLKCLSWCLGLYLCCWQMKEHCCQQYLLHISFHHSLRQGLLENSLPLGLGTGTDYPRPVERLS